MTALITYSRVQFGEKLGFSSVFQDICQAAGALCCPSIHTPRWTAITTSRNCWTKMDFNRWPRRDSHHYQLSGPHCSIKATCSKLVLPRVYLHTRGRTETTQHLGWIPDYSLGYEFPKHKCSW